MHSLPEEPLIGRVAHTSTRTRSVTAKSTEDAPVSLNIETSAVTSYFTTDGREFVQQGAAENHQACLNFEATLRAVVGGRKGQETADAVYLVCDDVPGVYPQWFVESIAKLAGLESARLAEVPALMRAVDDVLEHASSAELAQCTELVVGIAKDPEAYATQDCLQTLQVGLPSLRANWNGLGVERFRSACLLLASAVISGFHDPACRDVGLDALRLAETRGYVDSELTGWVAAVVSAQTASE